MAQFDANINLNVENRKALKGVTQVEGGINKLIKGVKEFERVFNEALNPKGTVQSRFQLEQERKALVLLNQQNEALTKQFRLAAQLGRAYDKLQVKAVGTELRQLERARTSQRALPGGRSIDQRRLPAAGQTSGTKFGGDITAAVRAEERVREAVLAEAERQLAADKRTAAAKEKIARAAQGEVSAATRTAGPPQPFGLLGPARGQRTTAAPVGSSGGSRYQQRLQAEVDRQIRVTGKLSNETLETVAKYNKVQSSADRLVKTQGRLSTKLNKAAKTAGGGKKGGGGGGGAGGGLAAGIGFPLLFGSGPGSILGGAIGSAGGFGTQILASAIGGIIDQAIANVAKLGQALNPLTADIDAITKAAGESGTAFEQLTKDIEEVIGKEKALAVATAQLATVVGEDGVEALKQFGEDTTALGNAASEALSQVAAAVADLINVSGILKGITATVDRQSLLTSAAASDDPEIVKLRGELSKVSQVGSKEGAGDVERANIEDRIVARQKEIQKAEQLKITEEANAAITKEKEKTLKGLLRVTAAENDVIQAGNSLLEEAAYQAQRRLIFAQTRAAVEAADKDTIKIGLAMAKEKNDLDQLAASRAEELARVNERAGKEAERSLKEQLALQRKIQDAQIAADFAARVNDLQIAIDPTPFAQEASPEETKVNKLLLQEAVNEKAIARIKNSNLDAQEEELRLQEQAEKNQLARFNIEKDTTKAIRERVENQTKLLEGAQLDLDLATAKTDKAKFALQLESDLRDLRRSNLKLTDEQIKAYVRLRTATFEALNPGPLQAYINKLDEAVNGVNAVENQIVAMAQVVETELATAMSSAIVGLVDGTKTVEEAFADMFANIGKAFIDMATQMLAQKAILSLLSAFGSGGNNYGGVPGGRGPQFFGPAFSGGGYTGNAPRTGGVDGQGGFPAILHPQETVVDHSMGQSKAMLSQYSPGNSSMGAGGPMNVNMNYTGPTMQFDDSRYVPVAAIPTIIKDAAKQGEARAMNTLKNSRGQRSRLGI